MQSSKQEDDYEAIVSRANELREQAEKYEQKSSVQNNQEKEHNLPHKTYITGLISGKIIDLEIEEETLKNKIKLTIRLQNDENITATVIDTKEYEPSNELIRLLHSKNISNYQIENLLGRNITLNTEEIIYNREKSAQDIEWNVHIPEKINNFHKITHKIRTLSRYTGDQYVNKIYKDISNEDDDIFGKILLYILFTLIGVTIFMLNLLVFLVLFDLTGLEKGLRLFGLSFIGTVFMPFMYRNFIVMCKKFGEYKEKDGLKS